MRVSFIMLTVCVSQDFFFHDNATTEIYTYRPTLSRHDALPISHTLIGRAATIARSRAADRRAAKRCMSARTPPPGSGIVITTAAEARPRITSTTMRSTSVKPRDFRSRTATRGLEIAGIEIGILALAPRCADGAARYDEIGRAHV